MARRFASRQAIAPRRKAEWSDVLVHSRILAQGAAQGLGSTAVGIEFTQSVTLARLRGNALFSLDVGAAGDSIVAGLGLIVVPENAFTVGGAAAMPSPINDLEAGWMWHQLVMLGPTQGGTDEEASIPQNFRVEIDVKAMRKVGPDELLGFVWDGQILAGTLTYDGMAAVRVMALLT